MQKKTIYKVLIIATLVVLIFVVAPTAIIVAHVAPIVSKFNEEFSGLPDEERYRYINEVKDAIDYDSVGTVVESRYDDGPGVITPSFYEAKIEGADAFESMISEFERIYPEGCGAPGDYQLRCSIEGLTVTVTRDEEVDQSVILRITDGSSGRRESE